MALFLLVLIVLEAMVVVQGWLAWRNQIFTVRQMQQWTPEGLPFTAHGGMWGDAFLISPLVAAIVVRHGADWSGKHIAVATTIGLVVSFVMHETYKGIMWPEAHVQFMRRALSGAGWVHLVYMGVTLAVLLLYYFNTPLEPLMWTASTLLVLHIVLGTHVILGHFQPSWYPGRPLESWGTWGPIGGVVVSTFGITLYRVLTRV